MAEWRRIGSIVRRFACRIALACAVSISAIATGAAEPPPPNMRYGPKYFPVDRIVMPVIYGGRLQGHLMLYVFLEVKDIGDRPLLLRSMPRLRDEYLVRLSRYITRRPFILERTNLREIKGLLHKATDDVIGKGKIEAVLIQVASNRRF